MTRDVHALAGPYALDALSEPERRQFMEHLADCDSCSLEVSGLQKTAARLGTAAALPPPPELRDRVMARIGQTRQVPPHVRAGRPGPARWLPRTLSIAAAACLLVAALCGVALVRAYDRIDKLEAGRDQLNAVLAAADARTIGAPVPAGGHGTVVISRQHGSAVVIMTGLPALPDGRAYELWLMGDGEPRPAGLMGAAAPPVLVSLGRSTSVGITVEPAAGSPAPTTAPVFTAEIPA